MAECHYWIGRSLEKLGRPAEARRHFERLAGAKPRPVDATRPLEVRMTAQEGLAETHYERALGLLGLGRAVEARVALARALEADPDHVGAAGLRRSLASPVAGGASPRAGARRPARPKVEATRPIVEAPPERQP